MKWISVKESVPSLNQMILCCLADGEQAVLRYTGDYNYEPEIPYDPYYTMYNDLERVTHWMPLPESPKEEKNPVEQIFCQRKDGSYPLMPPCCNDYYPQETEVEYGGNVRFATSKLCDNEGEEILCKCGKQGDLIISKDAFLVICRECKNKLKG